MIQIFLAYIVKKIIVKGKIGSVFSVKNPFRMYEYGGNIMSAYKAEKISNGFWRIVDPKQCCIYLIEGEDRALVIDTGMSEEPLLPFIKMLTDKPIDLLLTHAHMARKYPKGQSADGKLLSMKLLKAENLSVRKKRHRKLIITTGITKKI